MFISLGGLKKRASETQEEFAAKLLSWAGYLQTKFVAESVIREKIARSSEPRCLSGSQTGR